MGATSCRKPRGLWCFQAWRSWPPCWVSICSETDSGTCSTRVRVVEGPPHPAPPSALTRLWYWADSPTRLSRFAPYVQCGAAMVLVVWIETHALQPDFEQV